MPENIAYEPLHNNLITNSGLLHHVQQLSGASRLSHEMIVERGYRSATKKAEQPLAFMINVFPGVLGAISAWEGLQ